MSDKLNQVICKKHSIFFLSLKPNIYSRENSSHGVTTSSKTCFFVLVSNRSIFGRWKNLRFYDRQCRRRCSWRWRANVRWERNIILSNFGTVRVAIAILSTEVSLVGSIEANFFWHFLWFIFSLKSQISVINFKFLSDSLLFFFSDSASLAWL